MDILAEIARRTKERIAEKKKFVSLSSMIRTAEKLKRSGDFPFEKALWQKDIAFICEIKKASPSKGVIDESFPYRHIAQEYEAAGAEAISVLTEPYYFQGDDRYLAEISQAASVPLLRKDFVVDSYMIYEAKMLGASAILLICALLDEKLLAEYLEIAESLGLSSLVETHTEKEAAQALKAGAKIIGVNNRDLKTLAVDIGVSERMRKIVPQDKLFVAESGIRAPADIARLRKIHANAVLIGETLMKSADKKLTLERLRGERVD